MQSKIDALWTWFVANEPKVLDCFAKEHSPHQEFVVDGLNELILEIGMLTWEIGQDEDGSMFLIISPNRDADLLKLTKKAVSSAPSLSNWNFHFARPALAWNRVFSIYDEFMDEVEIDASEWQVSVSKNGTGLIDLTFLAPSLRIDEQSAQTALNSFVVNEIGEELRITRIGELNLESEPKSEGFAPLSSLKEVLA